MRFKELSYLCCPACNKINSKICFRSVKKDLSIKNYNYIRCKKCKTVFLSKKNLSEEKLTNLHLKNWHKSSNFEFDKKNRFEKQKKKSTILGAKI